ncbi:MAG: TadE/TadG family type IV pilus assembly protein [Brevundimonas sp.]|uniref:TadE/TadG family type IV pilus assembly protein n=1 Tax=Brevundimonas sp. TaxID=1871086 RepID=UPI00391947B6
MVEGNRTPGLLKRLRGDRRGVSAVEFALIAPVILLFYFGLAEFCQGFMAQKRMGRTAATVADLVTQNETVTRADIADVFEVGVLMMRPFPARPLEQRVTAVTRRDNGQIRVDWSRAEGMTARGAGSTVDIPAGLIANGESLVMTEIVYDYESPFGELLPGLTRFSHTYYLRPRKVEQVRCTDC